MSPIEPSPDGAVVIKDKDAVSTVSDDEPLNHGKRRTATWMDCAYHSVTAMVGAGVLGLPGVMSTLGWAGGLLALAASLFVSWWTYALLVQMHEVPDLDAKPGSGGWRRFDRYQDLASYVLGPVKGWFALVPFQIAVCLGMCITYSVVGSEDLHAAVNDWSGGKAPAQWVFYLCFMGLQLVLSQLPDFSSLGIVSLVGALMSLGYCAIAVVLSLMLKPAADVTYAPLANEAGGSAMEKAFAVFNALSTIMFAYGGHNVSLEIQAALPHPPTVRRMLRGVHIAFVFTGLCYFAVAAAGFRALGAAAGGNIILTLQNGPLALRNAARLMVVLHVAAAFQVYAHPAYESMENLTRRMSPSGKLGPLKLGYDGGSWLPRLVTRSVYVVFCTAVAVLLPFFGYLMGFVGAVAITPTTFLLPSILWLLHAKPKRWGAEWATNWAVILFSGLVGLAGAVGSAYLIAVHAREFRLFKA